MRSLKLRQTKKDESSINYHSRNISKSHYPSTAQIKCIWVHSYHPDFALINKFSNYPLRIFGEILIRGLIVSSFEHCKDADLCYVHINLCITYLYDINDELYQLGFVLYKSLKHLRRGSISKSILLKLICHYFCLQHENKSNQEIIKSYFYGLLKSKYLTLINQNHYKISMQKEIIFSRANNY